MSFQDNLSFKQFCFVRSDSVYEDLKRNSNPKNLAITSNAIRTAPATPAPTHKAP